MHRVFHKFVGRLVKEDEAPWLMLFAILVNKPLEQTLFVVCGLFFFYVFINFWIGLDKIENGSEKQE